MRKEQDLPEGKLRRGIAENAISLLFAQALVQRQEQGCCGFAQGLPRVCCGFAQGLLAALPRPCSLPGTPPKGNDHVGSGAKTFLIQRAHRILMLHLNIYNLRDSSILQDTWKGNWLSSHLLS